MNIATIEAGVISALESALGAKVKGVDAYGGELEDLFRDLKTASLPKPRVWVFWSGSDFEDDTTVAERATISVAIAARDYSATGPRSGMRDIYEDVVTALNGSTLGAASLGPLRPVAASVDAITRNLSTCTIDFTTYFLRD